MTESNDILSLTPTEFEAKQAKEIREMEEIDRYKELIDKLKESDFQPMNVTLIDNSIRSITAPNFKRKRYGKVAIEVPNEIFQNKEDVRGFNKGRIRLLLLFVEDKKLIGVTPESSTEERTSSHD